MLLIYLSITSSPSPISRRGNVITVDERRHDSDSLLSVIRQLLQRRVLALIYSWLNGSLMALNLARSQFLGDTRCPSSLQPGAFDMIVVTVAAAVHSKPNELRQRNGDPLR